MALRHQYDRSLEFDLEQVSPEINNSMWSVHKIEQGQPVNLINYKHVHDFIWCYSNEVNTFYHEETINITGNIYICGKVMLCLQKDSLWHQTEVCIMTSLGSVILIKTSKRVPPLAHRLNAHIWKHSFSLLEYYRLCCNLHLTHIANIL